MPSASSPYFREQQFRVSCVTSHPESPFLRHAHFVAGPFSSSNSSTAETKPRPGKLLQQLTITASFAATHNSCASVVLTKRALRPVVSIFPSRDSRRLGVMDGPLSHRQHRDVAAVTQYFGLFLSRAIGALRRLHTGYRYRAETWRPVHVFDHRKHHVAHLRFVFGAMARYWNTTQIGNVQSPMMCWTVTHQLRRHDRDKISR